MVQPRSVMQIRLTRQFMYGWTEYMYVYIYIYVDLIDRWRGDQSAFFESFEDQEI